MKDNNETKINEMQLDISSKDSTWINESLKASTWIRNVLIAIFGFSIVVCIILYCIFVFCLKQTIYNIDILKMFAEHYHLMLGCLSLLIVPSFLLWGLVRSIVKLQIEIIHPQNENRKADEALEEDNISEIKGSLSKISKLLNSLHPTTDTL